MVHLDLEWLASCKFTGKRSFPPVGQRARIERNIQHLIRFKGPEEPPPFFAFAMDEQRPSFLPTAEDAVHRSGGNEVDPPDIDKPFLDAYITIKVTAVLCVPTSEHNG